MRHPAIKAIHNAWLGLKQSRAMPDRSDILPSAFGASLPHIFMLEGRKGSPAGDISVRLAGSRLCAIFGQELRDHAFLKLFSHAAEDDAADMLAAVIEDGMPVVAGVSALYPERFSITGELILLPLAHAAVRHEIRILGAVALSGQRPLSLAPSVGLEILAYRVVNGLEQPAPLAQAPYDGAPLPDRHALLRRSRFRLVEGGLA